MPKFFDTLFRSASPSFRATFMSAQEEERNKAREKRARTEREGVRETEAQRYEEAKATTAANRAEDILREDFYKAKASFDSLRAAVQANSEKYPQETVDYVNRAANYYQQTPFQASVSVPTDKAKEAQQQIASLSTGTPEERSAAMRNITGDVPLPEAEKKLKELEMRAKETRKELKKAPQVDLQFDPEFKKIWKESKRLNQRLIQAQTRQMNKSDIRTLLTDTGRTLSSLTQQSRNLLEEKSNLNLDLSEAEAKIPFGDNGEAIKRQNVNRIKRQIQSIDDQLSAINLQHEEMLGLYQNTQSKVAAREGVPVKPTDTNKKKTDFILREKEKARKEIADLQASLKDDKGGLSDAAKQQIVDRVTEIQKDITRRANKIFGE